MTYCQFAATLAADSTDPNKHYHDHVYGFAVGADNELFARLVLEINQAGLSWTTILKKWQGFYQAYAKFDIATVIAVGAAHLYGGSGLIVLLREWGYKVTPYRT